MFKQGDMFLDDEGDVLMLTFVEDNFIYGKWIIVNGESWDSEDFKISTTALWGRTTPITKEVADIIRSRDV